MVPRASMLEPTCRSLPVCCTVVSYSCIVALSLSYRKFAYRIYAECHQRFDCSLDFGRRGMQLQGLVFFYFYFQVL